MSYKASKRDWADKGVFLGSLKPGIVRTPMLLNLYQNIPDKFLKDLIEPEAISDLIEYLLSSKLTNSSYMD